MSDNMVSTSIYLRWIHVEIVRWLHMESTSYIQHKR